MREIKLVTANQERLSRLRLEVAELEAKIALEDEGWHETFDETQRAYWVHPDYDGCRFYTLGTAKRISEQGRKLGQLTTELETLFNSCFSKGVHSTFIAAMEHLVKTGTTVEVSTDQLLRIAKVLYDA